MVWASRKMRPSSYQKKNVLEQQVLIIWYLKLRLSWLLSSFHSLHLHRCAASRPRRLKRVDKDKIHLHVTKGYYYHIIFWGTLFYLYILLSAKLLTLLRALHSLTAGSFNCLLHLPNLAMMALASGKRKSEHWISPIPLISNTPTRKSIDPILNTSF